MEHQLVLGVALTREQMTQFTNDLVRLVKRDVTLADDTTQSVLVLQLYLMPPSGSPTAGGRVETSLSVLSAASFELHVLQQDEPAKE